MRPRFRSPISPAFGSAGKTSARLGTRLFDQRSPTLLEGVGATREAATRALTELRKLELVDSGRGWVSLRDPDELVNWMAQSQ